MAPASYKFGVVSVTLAVIVLMSLVDASQTKRSVTRHPGKRIRNPRQSICQDGEYEHEGRVCCRCPAGFKVVSHCKNDPNDGKCEACGSETFSSHPNNEETCEPCRSCNHPNANLEETEPCNSVQNTICRCKKDHYCGSGSDNCILCQPCQQCGVKGIKVQCTSTNNTVCNDKTNGSNPGMIVGIIVLILVIFAIVGVLLYLKKRKSNNKSRASSENDEPATNNLELSLLHDIEPCLPDIADVLGWTDIQEIALRTRIRKTDIDSCRHDYPGDSKQQTLKLLMMWVEQQGSRSSERLLEILQNSGKRNKAERVKSILTASQ